MSKIKKNKRPPMRSWLVVYYWTSSMSSGWSNQHLTLPGRPSMPQLEREMRLIRSRDAVDSIIVLGVYELGTEEESAICHRDVQ